MKITLLVVSAAIIQLACMAQGTIIFANRNIPISTGRTTGGGNGNGTYNVPIWVYYPQPTDVLGGGGSVPGGVTVGLFTAGAPDNATPLATTMLRTDANSQFFATASQTVTIPGWDAGTTPTLLVRAWWGSPNFAAAKDTRYWGEWSFTTKPLGGTPASGGLPITPPSMTGWGPESGAGVEFMVPEPAESALLGIAAGALFVLRRRAKSHTPQLRSDSLKYLPRRREPSSSPETPASLSQE